MEFSRYKMIYNKKLRENRKIDKLRILGLDFVNKNKNKGKLLINNKKMKLQEYFNIKDIKDIKDDNINIGIILYSKFIDGSYMFKKCVSLTKFSISDSLENYKDDNFQEYEDNRSTFIDYYYEETYNISEVSFFGNLKQNKDDLHLSFSEIKKRDENSKSKDISMVFNYIYNYSKLTGIFPNCEPLIFLAYLSICHNIFTNIKEMFYNCRSLSSLPDISEWDTSYVKDMSGLFSGCKLLISFPDISKWNTSKVTDMSGMFFNCNFNFLDDISKWDTKNVKSMKKLFYGCSFALILPDISKWNTSNVTDISEMFYFCRKLTSLPNISKWNTNNVIDMSYTFSNCIDLLSLPNISKWNTNKVYNMRWMFCNCKSLKSLPNISKWNIKLEYQ